LKTYPQKKENALTSTMHKILLASLFILALQYAHAQIDSTTSANQIIKIEQALANGLPGDSALWGRYLDPAWHIVTEDGTGLFKKAFLKGFANFPKGVSGNIKVTNPVFSFHNNTAVIHYVDDEHENYFGQMLHTTYGCADTWYKTDTSWMMLSSEVFEIPQLPPVIKVDPNLLEQYTGTYRLAENKIAIITLKNDTLFIQKNTGKPDALLPEAANLFFRKSDARGRKFFIKDNTGQMMLVERRNGQDLVSKKIK
jgi:hypothetical protein